MAGNKPLWRRGVEAVDQLASPLIEEAMRHEAFSTGVSVVQRSRRAVLQQRERASRRFLHRLNLPAASDVNRLLTQITVVEDRVRTLSRQLEDQADAPDLARGARPDGHLPPEADGREQAPG